MDTKESFNEVLWKIHKNNDIWSASNIENFLERKNKDLFVLLEEMRHNETWAKLKAANKKYLKQD